MNILAFVGSLTIDRVRRVRYLTSVFVYVMAHAVRPRTWRRTVRAVLVRQILFTGAEAAGFTSRVAVLVGISAVVQAQLWLGKVGQRQLLGPVLVAVVIRELGPLLANLIVIGRSGSAITTELGIMKAGGEVRALDAQGIDPLTYLVVPRVVAMAVCVFCLTVIFIAACLLSGYVMGGLMGMRTGGPDGYVASVAGAVGPADVFNLLAKTLLPGALSGTICCTEGLSVGRGVTEIPPASSRAIQRSVVALFVIAAGVSLVTYL